MESGNVLLSRVVSNQVPSALKGLTSVFGMGTGGSPSLSSPKIVEYVLFQSHIHNCIYVLSFFYFDLASLFVSLHIFDLIHTICL